MKKISFSVSSWSYILSYSLDSLFSIVKYVPWVSVFSRSYILSYLKVLNLIAKYGTKKFPSPLGVMFSLILKNEKVLSAKKFKNVSVSSWSYILSYF